MRGFVSVAASARMRGLDGRPAFLRMRLREASSLQVVEILGRRQQVGDHQVWVVPRVQHVREEGQPSGVRRAVQELLVERLHLEAVGLGAGDNIQGDHRARRAATQSYLEGVEAVWYHR